MMTTCLSGDCAILILVKDSERLFEGGQVVRGQRFKDSFSVGLTKSGHNHLKVAQTWRQVQRTVHIKNGHNHLKNIQTWGQHPKIVSDFQNHILHQYRVFNSNSFYSVPI